MTVSDKTAVLRDRASMLAKARAFFMERGLLEVDCPILSASASVDAHIDLIPAITPWGTRYMHSSPEYGMKRLLAMGIGDIYQLSHVFRDGDAGSKHNPEFMMAEWYRVGMPFEDLIKETCDFILLFLGDLPTTCISYREAFQRYGGFDYLTISEGELLTLLKKKGIEPYANIEKEGRDALLNLAMGLLIEPQLGTDGLCALAYYPSTQAALAQTRMHGEEKVAERFEVYYKGMELCNGYHELADAHEQRQRFKESNAARKALGKEELPLDENFLQALEQGLPDCCGVAVGFDRLMMLRHGTSQIADVIPFVWDEA